MELIDLWKWCILRMCALTWEITRARKKPIWYSKLTMFSGSFKALPRPFVDRAAVEREALIDRLRQLAHRDDGYYEVQRRRKMAGVCAKLRKDRVEVPQLLVEAPVQVVNQE